MGGAREGKEKFSSAVLFYRGAMVSAFVIVEPFTLKCIVYLHRVQLCFRQRNGKVFVLNTAENRFSPEMEPDL